MKKRFTEEQIIGFLREAEASLPVKELCRRHGFSEASYYLWRSKFGGMSVWSFIRYSPIQVAGLNQNEWRLSLEYAQNHHLSPKARAFVDFYRHLEQLARQFGRGAHSLSVWKRNVAAAVLLSIRTVISQAP